MLKKFNTSYWFTNCFYYQETKDIIKLQIVYYRKRNIWLRNVYFSNRSCYDNTYVKGNVRCYYIIW